MVANITRQTIPRYEATDDQPTGKTIKQLAKAYGKNPQWFLDGTGQEEASNTAGVFRPSLGT